MPLDAPFRLGPFVVDRQGKLEPSDPGRFPGFHLQWRGCPVHARLDPTEGAADLVLGAVLGRVPSSAGPDAAGNAARRADSLVALRALTSAGGPLRLLPDHRVAFEARRRIDMPVSAGDLVTEVTCFLLDVAPYLDLLAEADVPVEAAGATTSGSAGTANT